MISGWASRVLKVCLPIRQKSKLTIPELKKSHSFLVKTDTKLKKSWPLFFKIT